MKTMMNIQDYYDHPVIRRGLRNFFNGCTWFLTSGSHYSLDPGWGRDPPVRVFPMHQFEQRLGRGPDVFRPIISKSGVFGVFDLEYYNWDKKTLFSSTEGRPFGIHDDIFQEHLEPVYSMISQAFGNEGIIDMTWSGYHVLTEIERGSDVYQRLRSLGELLRPDGTPRCLEQSLLQQYAVLDSHDQKRRDGISANDGIVYHQFGRVLEYLTHKIMRGAQPRVRLPITICDTAEECVSLDLSQYADPVYMRIIRSIFSSWDKHNMIHSLAQIVQRPPLLEVVRKYGNFENNNLEQLFILAHDYGQAIDYNQQFSGIIPRAGSKVLELIEEYHSSDLRQFHLEFDSEEHDPIDDNYKKAKYDPHLDFRARELMEYPNPSLLQPHNLQWMVSHLMDKGWSPKHIAGMIAGRYEAEGRGWDQRYWMKYNPRTRANFWARTYAGIQLFSPGKKETDTGKAEP